MIPNFADNQNPASLASRLRRERVRSFVRLLAECSSREVRVLDVGGTAQFWRNHREEFTRPLDVTLLNLEPQEHAPNDMRAITGDARNMSMFANREFDICFSNSVIEHVGGFQDQMRMAQEIRRVAKGYFVQTPNRYFPVEPHFLVPFWQFAPVGLRTRMLQRRNWGWMKQVVDPVLARQTVESIQLLTLPQFRQLFPDGGISLERIGPLTKSFTTWRRIQ